MANTLEFSILSIASDRSGVVLSDDTTYGSPARAATGLFVGCQKMNSDSTVDSNISITGDQDDPETDSEFTFDLPSQDGWFRFLIVSIPDFDSVATYDIYDAVFEPATGKVYRSLQNSNTTDTLTDTSWWEEIDTEDIPDLALNYGEANESTNIDSTIYEPLIVPNEEWAFANVIANASEEYLTKLQIPDAVLDTYSLLAVLLDGAYVYSDRSMMSQGERVVEKLASLIESID